MNEKTIIILRLIFFYPLIFVLSTIDNFKERKNKNWIKLSLKKELFDDLKNLFNIKKNTK